MKKLLLLIAFCLLLAGANNVWAEVITIGLNDPTYDNNPDDYIVDTGQIWVTEHSMVDVYVENILDPTRYKDWEFTFWLPEGSPALESMDSVEYDLGGGTVIDVGVIDLDPKPSMDIPGYTAYYASTFEPEWADYGTAPVGDPGGPYDLDIGNPEWVNFHVDVDDSITGPVIFSVYDVCAVPEPMTMSLLGLGGLALLRKRKQ